MRVSQSVGSVGSVINRFSSVHQDSLAEAEEKYRKAMVSNAQLHNEKSAFMYQVETLREELGDMEELLWEERHQQDHRSKVGEAVSTGPGQTDLIKNKLWSSGAPARTSGSRPSAVPGQRDGGVAETQRGAADGQFHHHQHTTTGVFGRCQGNRQIQTTGRASCCSGP